MRRRWPLVWVRQEPGTPGRGQPQRRGGGDVYVVASAAQARSPGAHPARVEMACWCQSGAVDRSCGRCRDRRVKPLPGVRHNSRQCQRLPTGIRPDRYRRSAHQRRLQAAAGGNSRARVCGSLPIVRDTARRRVRSGQACSDHRHSTPPPILRPCSHAVMQPCRGGATAGQGAAGSEQCQGHVSATAVCGSGNAAAGNQSSRSSRAQMPSFSRLTGKRVAAV